MSKKQQRTIAPVTLEGGSEIAERAVLIYNAQGIVAISKNKQETYFEVTWEEVKVLNLYNNKKTLGLVHFLLVIPCLYLGLIPALFLPPMIMHMLAWSKDWSGYGEIVTRSNKTMQFTPLGWFRVGFHMNEPSTIQKHAREYSSLANVEILNQ